jgi:hypothetical protein
MHPDMLSQTVQLEHLRRLQAAEAAAALHFGDDDEPGTRTGQPGRLARLLAMRPHRQHSSVGSKPAHTS